MNWIDRYQNEKGQKVTFRCLDDDFYNAFYSYYVIQGRYSVNTFGKHIKQLKTFMKWAEDNELHNNKRYRRFKAPAKMCDEDVLNSHEIQRIYNIDFDFDKIVDFIEEVEKTRLDGRQQEDRVKTLRKNWCIVVALYSTGMYPKDLRGLSKDSIINDRYIKFKRHKKVNSFKEPWCIVPYWNDHLFHFREVFEEVNYKFHVDIKSLYRDIKIITGLAGIKKKITARSFRKTFSSIWYFERELALQNVMKMTGHSRESSIKHYLNIDDEIIMDKIMKKRPMVKAGMSKKQVITSKSVVI